MTLDDSNVEVTTCGPKETTIEHVVKNGKTLKELAVEPSDTIDPKCSANEAVVNTLPKHKD